MGTLTANKDAVVEEKASEKQKDATTEKAIAVDVEDVAVVDDSEAVKAKRLLKKRLKDEAADEKSAKKAKKIEKKTEKKVEKIEKAMQVARRKAEEAEKEADRVNRRRPAA